MPDSGMQCLGAVHAEQGYTDYYMCILEGLFKFFSDQIGLAAGRAFLDYQLVGFP